MSAPLSRLTKPEGNAAAILLLAGEKVSDAFASREPAAGYCAHDDRGQYSKHRTTRQSRKFGDCLSNSILVLTTHQRREHLRSILARWQSFLASWFAYSTTRRRYGALPIIEFGESCCQIFCCKCRICSRGAQLKCKRGGVFSAFRVTTPRPMCGLDAHPEPYRQSMYRYASQLAAILCG
jgi:hypothetical protein